MRRALVYELPHLTHFYHGAIHALNVEQFTRREINAMTAVMKASQHNEPGVI